MIPILNQTFLLKALLGKFIDIMYISDSELVLMQDFILSAEPSRIPDKDDSEIYETLVYLRDLVQESNYKSIEELLGYFENQQNNLNKLIEPLLTENDHDLSGIAFCRVFNHSFKTDTIKKMTGTFFISTSCLQTDIVQNLYKSVSNDDALSNAENAYKELNLATHCLKSINVFRDRPWQASILPNSDHYYFKHYFESFSHPAKKYNKVISAIKKLKCWFGQVRMDKKKRKKLKSFYAEIYNGIQAEQPIKNDKFKTMLSRMMLISKFNNPEFRKYIKLLKEEKGIGKEYANCDKSDFYAKKLYYQYLSHKKWSILKSPHGHSWITSDNPGFSIDINPVFSGADRVLADPYWTDMDAKTMIYFPLSKEYCLRLQPENTCMQNGFDDHVISFEVSTEEELKVVNKLIISAKPQVIISEDKGIQQLQCT